MDNFLSNGQTFTVAGHPIEMLFTASMNEFGDSLCGVYHADEHSLHAVGLDEEFAPQWKIDLPAGVFQSQIQFVCAGQVDGHASWHWLMARPDNSVHLISSDGKLHNRVLFNAPLTGIAITKLQKESALLTSSEDGVHAWRIRVAGGQP